MKKNNIFGTGIGHDSFADCMPRSWTKVMPA